MSDVRSTPASEPAGSAPASTQEPAVAVFAPALLLLIELHEAGGKPDIHLHAGGQGYWIAKMIRALGATALICTSVGGEPGVSLEAIMLADGFEPRLTRSAHANAVRVEDRRGSERTSIAASDVPVLGRHEIDELYSATIGASVHAGVCVLAGSQTAPALPDDVFRRLVSDLRRNGVHVVADLSGEQLRAALEGGVHVVKQSCEELCADGWADGDSVSAVARGITKLRSAGAEAVVVSRSDRSTICGYDGELMEVSSPALEVVDGRGGGDSMTAALAVAAARGLPFHDAVRLAAAAGALNVSRHGLGTGRRDAIEEVATSVELRPARLRPRLPRAADLATVTRAELYELARARDVPGRSKMTRDELLVALSQR